MAGEARHPPIWPDPQAAALHAQDRAAGLLPLRRSIIIVALLNAALVGLVALSYWRTRDEPIEYATPLAYAMYLTMMGSAVVTAVLAGLGARRSRPGALLALACVPLFVLVTKLAIILAGGWELLHNKGGLGMEILSNMPNVIIDMILGGAAFALAAMAWAAWLRTREQTR